MRRGLVFATLTGIVALASCTNDFEAFSIGGDSSASGGADSGTGGSGASGGGIGGSGGIALGGGSGGVGATGATGGTGGAGATGGTGGCGATQKVCSVGCVSVDDPLFGCVGATCSPCALDHATSGCSAGACSVQTCDGGFGNCDANDANGCEESLDTTANCGDCGRACSSDHSVSAACESAACKHRCDLGFGDCLQPTSGNDDGCETDVTGTAIHCGSCGNDCTQQGAGSGFSCTQGVCGCTATPQCITGGGISGTCDNGLCSCGGTTCHPGEACGKQQGNSVCRCNGGAACSAEETCCQTPAGCRDLMTDDQSCGACGNACAAGTSCKSGVCSS